ncbi:SOS-induced cell division inhibitor SulA [Stutzerimonas kirkiae]|uniref:CDP-glycerol--UDP-pyrophosphoryl-N-acetylglucosaminyl-N-acetylmannosamine glycerophosphotransferase n=1 Tax=Stutzerimonas kirkiae TaxID=2211392 RepID=A0A4Q9R3X9_9GAMM|nr:SOS-induced cell division inhibitor SulA [Stutzerimonas kirkiae]TBU93497.1 CDP-glycerol--UDP-pyrophosphoryl-N-acetylglucosaminyl-N-acetylmannosamine glycerophosphotransferase [Stutzerimonas kirkiae]TBV01703.1 CDP-glycerol--UDP-pyrophosphoryl-N-acetylglucosaminyl-N-acetylmannosamine glycerophosphotransferase [Stutzerimonas kirkiae]TBV07401.1 CDP-glycerol--UDP-pyrophosphoryl-N-acetylglucosaminyl-N-acetylmannosamine glycerophosphotransferase [Stutzerimonas kirkiae]TBV11034.1 CDP-glycerol--UDP-p
MQFPLYTNAQTSQLPLFEAFLAPSAPFDAPATPTRAADVLSEMRLTGRNGLQLLAPVLRELSRENDERWLTIIAPPDLVSYNWLRDADLNRERILLLPSRNDQDPLELVCRALRLGRSHTVISWLRLDAFDRKLLAAAARQGNAQSLNIRFA